MKWIKVNSRHDLPRNGQEFLAIWKGRKCLAQHDEEEDRFYISWAVADSPSSMYVPQDREGKFNYWMPLPDYPEDW